MSGELYNCNHCEYKSNKKYNLYRHMVAKHIKCNVDICNSTNTNVNINDTNVNINDTNVNINDTNVNTDNKCTKCNKILSSKSYLNKHLLKCNGISNPLQCHICNRIFLHRASKSYHIKKCKEKQFAVVPLETKNTEIVSVVDSQNNELVLNESPPQAQQIITNNISGDMINNIYNINLISYNKEDEKIEFDISHLKLNELEHKIRVRCPDSSFKLFCDKLFENKNNQMIIKSNLRNKYSNIHLGMNIWEKILDNYIYPILMSHIAEKMIVFFNINSRKMKELDDYLQIMASQGYSNSNTTGYRIKYRRNIEQLKLLFNTFN